MKTGWISVPATFQNCLKPKVYGLLASTIVQTLLKSLETGKMPDVSKETGCCGIASRIRKILENPGCGCCCCEHGPEKTGTCGDQEES
jgi:hypothetical protein